MRYRPYPQYRDSGAALLATIPAHWEARNLALVRPNNRQVEGQFLHRAFGAHGINDQFRVGATGITRYGLGKYSLDAGVFPLPPLDEQRTIAAFLDRETAEVDALIAKKERLIELLQEKRSAVITCTVTGGLDPIFVSRMSRRDG